MSRNVLPVKSEKNDEEHWRVNNSFLLLKKN